MARMLGNFLHWYPGYTMETALSMPASQFFALNRAIRGLRAGQDARFLRLLTAAANPGERGKFLQSVMDDLRREVGAVEQPQSTLVVPYVTPGVREADGIREEHERRKASARRTM